MNRKRVSKRSRLVEPIWCDHCRVRIAPYEEAAIAGTMAFHKHCFEKEEIKKPGHGSLEDATLTLALA